MSYITDFFKIQKSKKSFFRDFSIIFSVIFIIVILLWCVIYKLQISDAEKEIHSMNTSEAEQCIKSMEETIGVIKKISINLSVDNNVKLYIMNGGAVYGNEEFGQRFQNMDNIYKGIVRDIEKISIYSVLSNTIYEDGIINEIDDENNWWIKPYLNNHTEFYVIRNEDKNTNDICFVSEVNSNNNKGILGIKAKSYKICNEITNNINYSSNFYWIDENNDIIYDAQSLKYKQNKKFDEVRKVIGSGNELDKRKYVIYEKESSVKGWKYYYVTERSRYSDKFTTINILMLISSVVLFIVSISMTFLFMINKFKPVLQLTDLLEKCSDGELMNDMYDEYVKNIASKIIALLNTNKELQNKIDSNVIERYKLQMNVLVSQINPHFVNNTLNVLGFISMEKNGKTDEVTRGITKLSKVIRHGFKSDVVLISVEEEIKFLNEYIELLKMRYKNFEIIWDFDDSIMHEKILKLIIQPLLENAVSYGISAVHRNGIVKIQLKNFENKILIKVADNGIGISKDILEHIHTNMNDEEISSKHIGIVNVYKRLRLTYGEALAFNIVSEENKGTDITIIIPKIQ